MKKVLIIIFAGIIVFFTQVVTAQKPSTTCVDPTISNQADAIKLGLSKQGMVVFQETMLSMTSMEPAPIAVRLQQGQTYQLIFVGSQQASKITLELFDGKDKKIDEEVMKGSDYILYPFTPQKTDIYLVTLIQKKGVKDMCGYFAVMMKDNGIRNTVKKQPSNTQPVKSATPPKTNTPTNNQRPNPNRTKATQQHQQIQK